MTQIMGMPSSRSLIKARASGRMNAPARAALSDTRSGLGHVTIYLHAGCLHCHLHPLLTATAKLAPTCLLGTVSHRSCHSLAVAAPRGKSKIHPLAIIYHSKLRKQGDAASRYVQGNEICLHRLIRQRVKDNIKLSDPFESVDELFSNWRYQKARMVLTCPRLSFWHIS